MSCVQERSDIMGSVGSGQVMDTQLSNIPALLEDELGLQRRKQHNRDGKVQTICSKQKKRC